MESYILDLLLRRRLSEPIHDWVECRGERPQPLRPGRPTRNARENRRWHLLINAPLEIEA